MQSKAQYDVTLSKDRKCKSVSVKYVCNEGRQMSHDSKDVNCAEVIFTKATKHNSENISKLTK